MPAISVGSVEVDVLPNTQGIHRKLTRDLVAAATSAGEDAGDAAGRAFGPAMTSSISDSIGERVGTQIGQQVATRIASAIRDSVGDGIRAGGRAARPAATRQGEQTGGAFARSLRARLEAAFRSMPKLDVRLGDTGIDADLARLRARLEALSNKTVGIDIDAETARAQAVDIEERLRRIGAAHPNVAVRADTAAAIAQLQLLQQQIDEVSADPLRIRAETDGGLGARLRAAVQQAEASLPNVNIGADTTPAQLEIARLRAQLTELRDARIGIDVDAATAVARLQQIQARLDRLSMQDADVGVRVDAGAASAQLAAFQAQVNRLDGQTAHVNVDSRSASANMSLLVTAALAFGPAIIPVLPVVAAGLGAIAAAGVAAAAGVGAVGLVAIPAIKGIASTLQAQKAAQDAATNATYQGGQSAGQGAAKALQLAGAQQSLASAHRNAARQIGQAESGVQDAVRSAAEASSRAADQVKQSRRSLADAVQQAADRQQQAAEQVQNAEDSLADAQRSARQAQQDLNQARKDAAQELADLADQLANAQLSERDAVLSVQEAQARLRATQAKGSKATVGEQQRAQLAYDEAVQRLKEQKAETKVLAAEKKAADKAGVEGSKTVKDAQESLREADEAVADQQKDLAKARVEAARQQVQSQRDISDAQEKVAEAQRNVARVQEDGARSVARAQEQLTAAQQGAADSIASAQRQIEQASLSAAGGVDQAAIAQAKYRAELAKLTPAARGTMNAYLGLRTAFGAWSKSLQPAVMPIFTRALNGLKNSLPGLTPFVIEAADAIKGLQDRASAGFKSPWWKQFKAELAGSVGPAITGLGISFGRIFKGMAGVVDAFLPHMDSISERMQKITGRFADWGAGLKGSPEFERFLSYSSEHAPMIAETLGKIATAFLDIGQALSPLSGPLLAVIGGLAEGVGWLAQNVPGLALGIYGLYLATKLWAVAQFIANGAMLAFNLISKAGPWGWIVLAILAVIAVVVYMYNRFDWFRNLVQTVWSAIQTAALWAWNNVLKPTFAAIWLALQTVGKWAMWLWGNAIKPAFDAIVLAGKILLTAIVVAAILPIIVVFKALGLIAGWLWENAIRPAFRAIAALAVWLYRNIIKPTFDAVMAAFRAVAKAGAWLWKNALAPAFRAIGDAAKWLYTNAIKPAFGWIADRATWVWNKGVKPAFDLLKGGLKAVGDAFKTAKDYIGEQWGKVSGLAKKPVQFIVDTVYNNGIRGVWNKVADAFGAPKLDKFKFASGGIMPGYTPGRDVHKFMSPTGGALELSGGEAIMRPEFTRAVGSGFVGAMNSIAKSRGAQGVKAALAPVFGGNPSTPTDTSLRYANGGITQSFADGGIFGWIGKAASAAVGAGSAAWNGIKKGASWLGDTLEASARAGVKNVVNPLLANFPGMDTGFGKLMRKVPSGIIDALFGYSKEADKKGGGGVGGPKIQAALKWAKSQNGLPYQWGGNGNPSWDCATLSCVITTPRGPRKLADIATGDSVTAFQDGRLVSSRVLAKWCTGEQEVYKVRTRNRELRVTAGHRVLAAVQQSTVPGVAPTIYDTWTTEWKHVRDLTRDDFLVTYTGHESGEGENYPEDLAWLLGLWVADGSVHPTGGLRFCVYGDLADKVQQIWRKYYPDRKSTHHERHGVLINHKGFASWMIDNGFRGKSHERSVPPIVSTWDRAAQDAFLEGYADGDGCYRGSGRKEVGDFHAAKEIVYTATSRELLESIRDMHVQRGDRATVLREHNRGGKPIVIGGKEVQNVRPIYRFEAAPGRGADQSTGAGHRPGLLQLVAQLKAENMSVQKVLSVEPDGVEETWDIEVEDSHSFVSDGLISHNCSGLVSAIESVIRGQKPHRRWATGSFSGNTAPPGWEKNGASAFKIGITNAGVGHTAGTLGKTNVESRGGDGVIIGKGARGYNDKLFTSWYGFQPGKFDSGGYLQPGLNLAYNGTGRPEPVFTAAQSNALTSMASRGGASGPASFRGDLYLDSGEFLGKVRGEATQVMHQGQQQLIQVLNAN